MNLRIFVWIQHVCFFFGGGGGGVTLSDIVLKEVVSRLAAKKESKPGMRVFFRSAYQVPITFHFMGKCVTNHP